MCEIRSRNRRSKLLRQKKKNNLNKPTKKECKGKKYEPNNTSIQPSPALATDAKTQIHLHPRVNMTDLLICSECSALTRARGILTLLVSRSRNYPLLTKERKRSLTEDVEGVSDIGFVGGGIGGDDRIE